MDSEHSTSQSDDEILNNGVATLKENRKNVTQAQCKRMFLFMDGRSGFTKGKMKSSEETTKFLDEWNAFTSELNSMGPPSHSSSKWRRIWTKLKSKKKSKLASTSVLRSQHNNKIIKALQTRFPKIKQNAHDMIINAICGNDDSLFTSGFDGKVKRWKNLDRKPTVVETIEVGKNITALCVGPIHTVYVGDPESEEGVTTFVYTTVYAADSDGVVRRLKFSA